MCVLVRRGIEEDPTWKIYSKALRWWSRLHQHSTQDKKAQDFRDTKSRRYNHSSEKNYRKRQNIEIVKRSMVARNPADF